ncbi:hypothetical protein [Methylovulum psychrotolerans]|uniref:Uncharacterized protein n=1 Tax=Methylovulum psychrotolerans TaxID=1704499 RepID=A0A2S5CRF1_9GAMM|nr:hypothetical protein [Methylovulum psychrotolerans]POZ53384.1 hypothetical protein AADEFJLK_00406 [Methylovulum psychrotolerans]
MEFVSLDDVLNSMADCVTVSPRVDADEAAELKFSKVAATFHEVLHNFPDLRPKWMERHKETGRYLQNDAVCDEGMKMLIHMAGWYQRESTLRAETHRAEQRYIDHRLAFLRAMPSLDDHEKEELSVLQHREIPKKIAVGPGRDIHSGQYRMDKFFRRWQIGFDRTALVAFLNQYGINHTLGGGSGSEKKPTTVTGGDTYNLREASFNAWLEESKVDITVLKVKTIFEQMAQTNGELWKINLNSFRTEFWGRYADTHGIKKKAGRPSNK